MDSLTDVSDVLQFLCMIFFVMMGFGTAFILLHFDDRDNFSTGLATIYRVLWSGMLGDTFDSTGMLHIQLNCRGICCICQDKLGARV